MGKGGRARKSGPRSACGKLQQTGIDPIAPTLFQRILTEAKKGAVDERLGTELGRLFMHGELTSAQVAAGFRMARIYQDFERYKGRRRSPASPSYGGGGDHSIAEELLNPESLSQLEDSIREAVEKYIKLDGRDGWMKHNVSRGMRSLLQELCVEDRYIGQMTAEIRGALDRLGMFFGFTSIKHASQKQKTPADVLAEVNATASTPAAKTFVRKPNLDRIYWIEVARRLRPDLSTDDLGKAYDVQRALVARGAFRLSKPAEPETKIEVPRVRVGAGVLGLPPRR